MPPFSLYVHIPFCYQKCPYCDFNTYALPTFPEWEYMASLLAELDYRETLPEWKGREVQTIYFGGGTPSVFTPASYETFLAHVRARFPMKREAEITLEANPGALSFELLSGYRSAGITRLSLGAQSLNEEILRGLGRTHTPEQIEASIAAARQAGFAHISLDLIFGAPRQTLAIVQEDLAKLSTFSLPHISTYGLTIEKGTPFSTSVARGDLKLPPEEEVLAIMGTLDTYLAREGLAHYEISNYARPGYEAQHNLAYWNGDDYLGLGAGAHSFTRQGEYAPYGKRWSNYALPKRYQDQVVVQGFAESWSETIEQKTAMFEYFFLGLRKLKGISLSGFQQRFGTTVESRYPKAIPSLIEQQLLWKRDGIIGLTQRGTRLMDSVIEVFA